MTESVLFLKWKITQISLKYVINSLHPFRFIMLIDKLNVVNVRSRSFSLHVDGIKTYKILTCMFGVQLQRNGTKGVFDF